MEREAALAQAAAERERAHAAQERALSLTTPHRPLGAAGHRFVLSSPKAVPRARLLQLLKGKYPAFRLVDGGTPTTRTLSPTLTLTYPYLYS